VIHLDTTFLVDLLREQRRDQFGPASACLEGLPDGGVLAVSVHVLCELMAGALSARAPATEAERVSRLCEALVVQYPDHPFATEYGRLLSRIHASGSTIPGR
jgi:predicted nucleic acid-binding protein